MINKSIVLKTLLLIGILMTITYVVFIYFAIVKDKQLISQIQKYNLYTTNKALDIAQKENLKNSENDILSYIKIIAKNYSISLLNYDIDGLKSNVILSMNKEYIKAIKITHTTDNEVLLIAINNDSKIQFVNSLPKDINIYKKFKTDIISKDDMGLILNIGKLILYYDKSIVMKKINNIKIKTKKDINTFNITLNEKLSSLIVSKLIIYIVSLLIMLVVITIVLRKQINEPLQKLYNGLDNFFLFLNNEKNSIEKIQINTKDEFGQMAKSLNENIIISSRLHKQINDLNYNLEERIKAKTFELKEREETYKALFYKSSDGILLIKNNNIIDYNNAATTILGFKDGLLNKTHDSLFPTFQIHKVNSSSKMKFYMNETLIHGVCRFEWIYKKNDGILIWVEVVLTKISILNELIIHTAIRDINNKKELEKTILKEKEKAQSATKLKSEFLANMSHEIRTPMNGIIGMTYLVLQTSLKNKQRDYIEKIDNSAKNLLGIVNDILDFSKIEAGKLVIEENEFNMFKLIEDIVNLVEYKIRNKNLELIVDYDSNMSDIFYGDNLRISQVITNLLSNAIKFTSEGSISITIKKINSDKYRFEVKDTGIGLNNNEVKKLFKSFSQADSSITRKYGGTGLGLKISKQLIELMNGRIWLESVLDVGSIFTFEIPLKEIKTKVKFNQFKDKKILIIDDNQLWHDILSNILKMFDIEIHHAYSGEEAIEKICNKKTYYDLLLVDWNMPILDGIQTINIIKEKSNISPDTIIMLSSFRLESVIKLLKDAGISIFLQKPINPSSLNDILSSVFLKDKKSSYHEKNNTSDNLTILQNEIKEIENFSILLTEDNLINQEIIVGILEGSKIEVDIAFNGQEAIDMLKQNSKQYSIILMDLQMPVMDGFEATKIIRKSNKHIPIIALTANAMKSDVEDTKRVGMNGHLNKPLDIIEFFNIILKYYKLKNNNSRFLDDKQIIIPNFTNINIDIGLKYLIGNRKLYLSILSKFYKNYVNLNLENLNNKELELVIHTIKGLSANIGATKLNTISIELEKSLDKNLFTDFYSELNKVMEELKYLNK